MATDLVSEVVEVVSPTISSRIASALGLDPAMVQKAIVVAAPVLIGALISHVSKPQGANKLNDVVRKQEPGMLSSWANVIGEPGQLIRAPASSRHSLAVRRFQVLAKPLDNMPALVKAVLKA
jgi:uncharacterized protein DUF937